MKFAPGAFQATPILPPQPKVPQLLTSGKTVVERDLVRVPEPVGSFA